MKFDVGQRVRADGKDDPAYQGTVLGTRRDGLVTVRFDCAGGSGPAGWPCDPQKLTAIEDVRNKGGTAHTPGEYPRQGYSSKPQQVESAQALDTFYGPSCAKMLAFIGVDPAGGPDKTAVVVRCPQHGTFVDCGSFCPKCGDPRDGEIAKLKAELGRAKTHFFDPLRGPEGEWVSRETVFLVERESGRKLRDVALRLGLAETGEDLIEALAKRLPERIAASLRPLASASDLTKADGAALSQQLGRALAENAELRARLEKLEPIARRLGEEGRQGR